MAFSPCIYTPFLKFQKYFMYVSMFYSMFYVPTKSFQEKMTFYMIYVNMINFGTKISLFGRVFFSFLHAP
jgi:hypothetical protein